MKILVTGMSGLIGTALRAELENDHELSALNRSDVDGVPTTRADLSDFDSIRGAFDGIDTVVHLAAKAGERFTWDELLNTNIVGTRHVFEAAREGGCRRVVFASSGATVSGYEADEPYRSLVNGQYDGLEDWPLITTRTPTRPSGVYGATKVWGEALAQHLVDTTDLSIVSVRLGYVNAEDKPTNPRAFSVWCSQRDIVDFLVRAVSATDLPRYDVAFVTSNNRYGYRDLADAKARYGFEPRDAAEDHR